MALIEQQETPEERRQRLLEQIRARREEILSEQGGAAPTPPVEAAPSFWERVRAVESGFTPLGGAREGYQALQERFPGLFYLDDEERQRSNERDLAHQERRAPMRRAYREFVEDGGVDDIPFPIGGGVSQHVWGNVARHNARADEQAANEALERAQRVVDGEEEGTTMHALPSAAHGFVNEATRLPSDALRVASNVEAALRGEMPQEDTWLYGQADAYREQQQEIFPTDSFRQQQQQIGQALGEGLGSTVPYLAGGVVAGSARLPAMMAMGSTQGGSQALEDAVAHDASFAQGAIGTLVGMGIGVTEAIPLSRAMGRVERFMPRRFSWRRVLQEGGAESLEEAIQEGGAHIAQNINARTVGWDPDRDVLEGAGYAAALGGLIGFAVGGGVSVGGQLANSGQRALSDDLLAAAIIQGEVEYNAAWDAMKAQGYSTPEIINQLDGHVSELETLRDEAERRSMPLPEPGLEGVVPQEIQPEIDRLVDVVSQGLAQQGQEDGEIIASTAIFQAKLETLATKDPEAFAARIKDMNLRIEQGEPGQASNELQQFAGVNAKTADRTSLARAQELDSAGTTPEEIRQETGWHRGQDRKWRFEVDDSQASWAEGYLDPNETGWQEGPMGDMIQHEQLFDAYPVLQRLKTQVRIDPSLKEAQISGGYGEILDGDPSAGPQSFGTVIQVEAPSMDAALGTLMHETQHAIQHIERFAPGGNPDQAKAYYAETMGNGWTDLSAEFADGTPNRELLVEAIHTLDEPTMRTRLLEDPEIVLFPDQRMAYEQLLNAVVVEELNARAANNETLTEEDATQLAEVAFQEYKAFLESPEMAPIRERAREIYGDHGAELVLDEGMASWVQPGNYAFYMALAGEVEARNTEARRNMSAEERRATAPGATEDMNDQVLNEQIAISPASVYKGKPSPFANSQTLNQSVPLRRGTQTLKKYGLEPGKTYKTREIAAALEARQRKKYGTIERGDYSPAAARRIAGWMVDEVMFEVDLAAQQPGKSAVGWYTEKFQRALDEMAARFPELAGDMSADLPGVKILGSQQAARNFMTALIAITSDGAKVRENFRFAAQVYEQFRNDGTVSNDVTFGGERNKSMRVNLANIQDVLINRGPQGMHTWLLKKDTVSNLRAQARAEGVEFNVAYKADMQLPNAALVFGPKLGAFYANLMGDTGYLTMDRWWSRTFNRMRGTLLAQPTEAGLARFRDLLRHDTGLDTSQEAMTDHQLLAHTVEYVASYAAKGYKNGTITEKAANTLYKHAYEALEDQPFNASDREFMIRTTENVRRRLKRRGVEMSIADIQAVLWYYEKRLYGQMGARQTADISYEEIAKEIAAQGGQDAGRSGRPGSAGSTAGSETTLNPQDAATTAPVTDDSFTLNQSGDIDPVSTPEFREWFGDSKVVGPDGLPLVVYHGTPNDFVSFDTLDFGAWFAVNPSVTEKYNDDGDGQPRTIPAYLRIENPFVVPEQIDMSENYGAQEILDAVNEANGTAFTIEDTSFRSMKGKDIDTTAFEMFAFDDVFRRKIEGAGFDGMSAFEEGELTWNAFQAGQIKSPFNEGSFDGSNPNILMQSPTETQEFKAWWEDSKVVDGQGNPEPQYHNTNHWSDFSQFKILSHFGTQQAAKDRSGTRGENTNKGAEVGERTLPVYLRINNPIDVGREAGPRRGFITRPWQNDNDMFDQVADVIDDNGRPDLAEYIREQIKAGPRDTDLMPGLVPTSHENIMNRLIEEGYDGIKYTNRAEDYGSTSWVVFSPEQIKSPFNEGAFDGSNPDFMKQENRASVTIPEGGVFSGNEVLIRLGEQSDVSSFMHESAHLFLEMYRELAADSKVIKEEYDAMRQWLGVEEGARPTREQHEKFAEGFEAYLKEGVAPVEGLEGAFEAFKNWMGEIYRALRGSDQISLDLEGRRVMDSLFIVPTSERTLARRKRKKYANAPGSRQRGRPIPVNEDGAVAEDADAKMEGLLDEKLETVAIRDLVEDLKRILGTAVTEGRMTQRGADGEFNERTHEIRLRFGEDFATLVHEAGHMLAARHPEAYAKLVREAGQEMLQLNAGVDVRAGEQMDEAFAEMVRIFVESPVYLAKNTPNALKSFVDAFFSADEKLMSGLQELSRRYNRYMTQSSARAIEGHISRTGVRNGISGIIDGVKNMREEAGYRGGSLVADWIEGFYAAMFDATAPIYRVQRDLASMYQKNHGTNYDFSPSNDFSRLARLAADGYQGGSVDIMNGVVGFKKLKAEGPALGKALQLALGDNVMTEWKEERVDQFGAYLASRRIIEEYRRKDEGLLRRNPDRYSLAEHLQAVRDHEAANPKWREAADMVNEWGRNLLKKKLDAGFITQEQYTRFTETRSFYVPLLRDTRRGRGSVNSTSSANNNDNRIRRFQGSDRSIINPIESMIRDAYQTNQAIWRNETIGALYDMAVATGAGSAEILTEVPAQQTVVQGVDAKKIFRLAAERAGVDEQDAALVVGAMEEALDGQTMTMIYGLENAPELGEQIVYLWRDGQRKMLRLNNDKRGQMLWDALVGLGKDRHHWLVDLVSLPTRILTQSITGHPAFPLVNWVRDQFATATLSPNGFTPFVTGAEGAANLFGNPELVQEYMVAGGHMGGINASIAERNQRSANVQDLRSGRQAREVGSWRGVSAAFDVTESSTRLGNYKAYRKMAKKLGMSDWDAALHSAYQARDVIDYRRKGGSMTAYIFGRLIPFFNPALQGTEKAVRTALGGRTLRELPRLMRPIFSGRKPNLSEAEKQDLRAALTMWPWMAAMAAFSAMLTAAHQDDPDYAEIDDRMRATHWHLWKDENGNWIRMPKPFELAVPANILERYLLASYWDDPTQRGQAFLDLQHTMLPPGEIPILQVAGELMTNEQFDNGRPIVPDHMSGLPAPLQYSERTSSFSRWVGESMGWSPMLIDHMLFSLGGTYAADYRILERGMDPNAPAMGTDQQLIIRRFIDNPSTGSQSVTDFWREANRRGGNLSKAQAAYRALVDAGETERALAYFRDLDPVSQEWVLVNTHGAGSLRFNALAPGARDAHPMRRGQEMMQINSQIRRMLSDNSLRAPGSNQVIELPGEERGMAIDLLRAMNVWEADNALRQTGFHGRIGRPQADYDVLWETLEEVSPDVARLYQQRTGQAVGYDLIDADMAATRWQNSRGQVREIAQDTERVRGLIQMRQAEMRMRER